MLHALQRVAGVLDAEHMHCAGQRRAFDAHRDRGGAKWREVAPLARTIAEHLKRRSVVGPDNRMRRLAIPFGHVETESRQVAVQLVFCTTPTARPGTAEGLQFFAVSSCTPR